MDTNLLDAIARMALQAGLGYRAPAGPQSCAPTPFGRVVQERPDSSGAGPVSDNPGKGNLSPAP